MNDKNHDEIVSDLMQQHQSQLRLYILGIYPNQHAVEDILQETNRVIWTKRASFEQGSNFGAWARTIAKFQTLSFLKSRNSKNWLQFDSELVVNLALRLDKKPGFGEARHTHLKDCVDALPKKDQRLIFLKYKLRLTNKAIGTETGRPEGGLKQAFLRIRNALRMCVERKEKSSE